jgi:hypothetical protein
MNFSLKYFGSEHSLTQNLLNHRIFLACHCTQTLDFGLWYNKGRLNKELMDSNP